MDLKYSNLRNFKVVYNDHYFDIAVTDKYYKKILEYINQHFYCSLPSFMKPKMFYQKFINIIDSDIFKKLHTEIILNKSGELLVFKTDIYLVAKIDNIEYYLCERDHSIIFNYEN